MALDFYLTPEDVRAYEADAWAAPHLKALADDWEQQALAKLNAPAPPDPGLAAHLGGTDTSGTVSTGPSNAALVKDGGPAPEGASGWGGAELVAPPQLPTSSPPYTEQSAGPDNAIEPAGPGGASASGVMPAGGPDGAPTAAPALPAPDAPLPTDYGPVPRSPQRQPIATAPAAPAPSPSPFGDLVNYARQAAQKVGIDPDLFTRQINQESNFNPAARSPAGAQGIAQIVPRWHPGVDVTDPYASLDYAANLMSSLIKQHGGDVRTALVAYNGGQGAVDALNAGTPYAESREYVNRIMSGSAPAPSAASAAGGGNLSLSQFGDKTLTADEAYAACGPAAAARLASEYGNAIPLSVALQAAKQVGWTPGGGMNGITNEKKLMDALGLPAELDTSGDWGKITSGIGAGRLVTISTGGGNVPVQYGHYFSANGARQRPDGQIELYVGQSGKDLKAGKEWMTPAEIEAVAGPINGALFSDPSRAVMAGDWHQKVINREGLPPPTPEQAMADLTQAAQKAGVQRPDETISNPFGEAFRQVGNVAGQVGDVLGGAIGKLGAGAGMLAQGQEAQGRGATEAADLTAQGVGGAIEATGSDPNAGPIGITRNAVQSVVQPAAGALADSGLNTARREYFPNITEPGHPLNPATPLDENAALMLGGMTSPLQSANPLIQRTGQMLKAGAPVPPTDSIATRLARAWTNRNVSLDKFQEETAKLAGLNPRLLPTSADAQALVRLSADPAAEIRVQQELKPAIQAVGGDTDWLSTYLMHANNVDVAKQLGERVRSAAVDVVEAPPALRAELNGARTSQRMLADQLATLQSDPMAPADRLSELQRRVTVANNRVDRLEQQAEGSRQEQLQVASRSGQVVAQQRKFPGGFTAADSAQVLADLPAELGPARYAKVQQAAVQVGDFVKGIRTRMVDSGLIDQATATQWEQQYPNWVPTRILDYMDEASQGLRVPKKLSLGDAGVKKYTIDGTARFAEDPLGSLVGLARSVETRARKNEVVNALVNLDQMRPAGRQMLQATDRAPTAGENVVQRINGGQVERYIAPPELAAVINGPVISQAPGYVHAFTNFQRAVTTVLSPAFALVRNPSLDVPEYVTRELSRAGGNPTALPGIVADLMRGYAESFKGFPQGEFRGATARFMTAGGGDSGMVTRTVADRAAAVQALSRSNVLEVKDIGDIQRILKDVVTLKPISALAQRTEYGPRTASFIRAERAGATGPRAALAGRTVTLDFAEGGTLAKTINSFVPFFNVGFQGSAQMVRMARENPVGAVSSLAMTVGLPSVAATAWNRADPQRSKDYEDVPQYLKDQGIVLMLPGEPATDARGNRKPPFLWLNMRGFAPISSIARDATERALQATGNTGANPENAQDLLSGIFWASSPTRVNALGDVPGAVASANFPLPGGGTALQLALNKDIFRRSDIVSKNADQNAPQAAKELADALTNIAQLVNPNAEIHPSQVNFAVRELLGGVGSTAMGAREMVPGGVRTDTTAQGTPVLGGMLRAAGIRGDTGAALSKAIEQPVSSTIERALRDAGLSAPTIPTSISVRSQMTGNQSPPIELRQQERAEYQRLMSERLNERLAPILADPTWTQRPIASRNKVLDTQVKAAREYAEAKVYSAMAPEDRQARMQAGRLAQQPKAKP